MADFMLPDKVINDSQWETNGRVLSVFEQHASTIEGHFRTSQALDEFCQSSFDQIVQSGTFAISKDCQLIRFSPFSIYIVSEMSELDHFWLEFPENFTEITHGKCLLSFQGDRVLAFFRSYCSIDLMGDSVPKQAIVKTLFVDYEILLWWFCDNHLELLIDRSFAQSFVDFVQTAFMRRS